MTHIFADVGFWLQDKNIVVWSQVLYNEISQTECIHPYAIQE